MSSAPTDCRIPDASDRALDAASDGTFNAAFETKLETAMRRALAGHSFRPGEARVLAEEIAQLRTRVEALRIDAQRYQWLRDMSEGFTREETESRDGSCCDHVAVRDWYGDTVGEGDCLDDAVDAAMTREDPR